MSQCVPSWDVDENPAAPRFPLRNSNANSTTPEVTVLDYEVAELTWENGQPSLRGLGLPLVPAKPLKAAAAAATSIPSKYTWEKPRASGTLESIVNQATHLPPHSKSTFHGRGGSGGDYRNDLVSLFDTRCTAAAVAAAATSNTVTMDALVPCSNRTDEQSIQAMESTPGGLGTCVVGCSTHVASCGGPETQEGDGLLAGKLARTARVPMALESSGRDQSVNGSGTLGTDNCRHTCDRELGVGFTSASMDSPENTSSAKEGTKTTTADEHDSVWHSAPQREARVEENKKKGSAKSSVSNKRSRAAAIHSQSERKRRDKINQRMKTLQKLVPNSSKTDKASMLDEVIEYLKQLQAQVQMMSRMKMSSMMLPMTMQQQLQMSMMAPMGFGMGMGMGIGMGMGMDVNTMSCANIPSIPPVLHPSSFMPMASWDASGGDRQQGAPATVMSDPFSTFFACQSQPMTMDAYSRMAAMYQQLHQPPASNSKS